LIVLPGIEILNTKELSGLLAFIHFQNWSNELSHKSIVSDQFRPEVMDEIYN